MRESIRQELEYDEKYLRNSVIQFLNYVRIELKSRLKYARLDTQKAEPKINDSAKKAKPQQKALRKDAEPGKGPSRDRQKEKKTGICWDCQGDHRLDDCPNASEAEKAALFAKKREEWKIGKKIESLKMPYYDYH